MQTVVQELQDSDITNSDETGYWKSQSLQDTIEARRDGTDFSEL